MELSLIPMQEVENLSSSPWELVRWLRAGILELPPWNRAKKHSLLSQGNTGMEPMVPHLKYHLMQP